jgi:hypothetical protein
MSRHCSLVKRILLLIQSPPAPTNTFFTVFAQMNLLLHANPANEEAMQDAMTLRELFKYPWRLHIPLPITIPQANRSTPQ